MKSLFSKLCGVWEGGFGGLYKSLQDTFWTHSMNVNPCVETNCRLANEIFDIVLSRVMYVPPRDTGTSSACKYGYIVICI